MASFDLFLPILLRFEGCYVHDPSDPGGETNKGITMATFQQCSHELLGLDPTSKNLRALTEHQAGIIYRALYWNKMSGDDFELQELANMVCDFYVNAGTRAITLLQRIMNGMGANVEEDGRMKSAAIDALHGLPQSDVYRQYKQRRIAYYKRLGQKYPKFLKGWLNRVAAFPDL